MLARSFLIESSSKLLVTRTGIKARLSLILGRIRPLILEFCPWVMKISHFRTWISLKPVGQSLLNFMCSINGVGERLHKVLGQIGSKLSFLTNVQNLATIFTTIFFYAPVASGVQVVGLSVCPSIAQVKTFVQGRISETIDDRKLKKRLLTYNGKNGVSGLFTCEWFALIAEKTTFDLGTLDSGEQSLPLGYFFLLWSFHVWDKELFCAWILTLVTLSWHQGYGPIETDCVKVFYYFMLQWPQAFRLWVYPSVRP